MPDQDPGKSKFTQIDKRMKSSNRTQFNKHNMMSGDISFKCF